jgi:EAL domain-containing protein (putative c-di-GMP-specific phosphodiesterase class I)
MEFIPLAEETGLIHEIGDWVFREAAHWAQRWRGYRDDFQVSLNSSPVQLMVQPSGQSWLDCLGEIGLSGEAIIVEITEGVLLNATDAVVDRLIGFRDAGIQVAIDDFGTGYSALAYLKKFDIDYLKIDKSFISGIEQNPDDLTLSRAIVAMAHSLALKVVAEGVETAGQSEILAAMGCDHVQGYFYSRPIPPEEFEKLLATYGQT